jgi:hypothetical protein
MESDFLFTLLEETSCINGWRASLPHVLDEVDGVFLLGEEVFDRISRWCEPLFLGMQSKTSFFVTVKLRAEGRRKDCSSRLLGGRTQQQNATSSDLRRTTQAARRTWSTHRRTGWKLHHGLTGSTASYARRSFCIHQKIRTRRRRLYGLGLPG